MLIIIKIGCKLKNLKKVFYIKPTQEEIEKSMELNLYIKEGEQLKLIKVPAYVVKNLLRDRLSSSELDRIHRLAKPVEIPNNFKAGSVIANFTLKTAECYQTKIDIASIDATWEVNENKMTLQNY